jgi:hypothetical protein
LDRADEFQTVHVEGAFTAAFSADEKSLFVGRGDGRITILDADTLVERATIPMPGSTKSCIRLRVSGRILLAVDLDKNGHFFQVGKNAALQHVATVKQVVATSNGLGTVPLRILLANGVLHSFDQDSLVLLSEPTAIGKVPSNTGLDVISPRGELFVHGGGDLARISLIAHEPKWDKFDRTFGHVSAFDLVGDSGLVLASRTKVMYVDGRTKKVGPKFEIDDDITVIIRALSKPGSFVAALNDGSVILFSLPLVK